MDERRWTAEELVEVGRAADYSWLTKWKIERWRKADLLPRPTRKHLGRGRGTKSTYPPGTDRQLLNLCALRPERIPLAEIAWRLWLKGYDLAPRAVRRLVREEVSLYETLLETYRSAPQEFPEALAYSEPIRRSKLHKTIGKVLKRRINADNAVNLILSVGFLQRLDLPGTGWRDLSDLLRHVVLSSPLGTQHNEPGPVSAAEIKGSLDGVMGKMPAILEGIGAATERELMLAAEDARLLRHIPEVAKSLSRTFGVELPGLQLVQALSFTDPFVGVGLMAGLVYWRRQLPDDVDRLMSSIRQLVEPVLQFEALVVRVPGAEQDELRLQLRQEIVRDILLGQQADRVR